MRVTTQMTMNTLLLNLNKNLTSINKYQLQMATGQKIQVASEDPIVAALALKFRTNVSQTVQYRKNADQAESWMNITESSVANTVKILDGIYDSCLEGASDDFSSERNTIISQIAQLKKQLINEANADYAGRYVFGGYKTDQNVMYTEDVNDKYNITQHLTKDNIETIKAAVPNDKQILNGSYSEGNYIRGEYAREIEEVDRINLPYSDVTNIKFVDSQGNEIPGTYITAENTHLSNEYDAYSVKDDEIKYLSDTGEILLGKNISQKLKDTKDFDVNYDKKGFKPGDINPQHYFDCRRYIDGEPKISNGVLVTSSPNVKELNISYTPKGSTDEKKFAFPVTGTAKEIKTMKSTDTDAYKVGTDEIRYLEDTGEILFGKNIVDEVSSASGFDVSYKPQDQKFNFDGTEQFPNSMKIPKNDFSEMEIKYTYNGADLKISSKPSTPPAKYNITLSDSTNNTVLGNDEVRYLKDTGEILFGKNVLSEMANSTNISVKGIENNEAKTVRTYEKLDGGELFGSELAGNSGKYGTTISIPTKEATELSIKIDNTTYSLGTGITSLKSTDANAYAVGDNEIRYISDTGELVFGKNIMANASQSTNIEVTANKTSKEVGDRIFNKTDEKMEYEFGTDNKMPVNSNASDIFKWELIADLDDLSIALGSVNVRTEDEIKAQLKLEMGADYDNLKEEEISKKVAAIQAGEEKTCREVLRSRLASGAEKVKNYNEDVGLAQSELGTRMNRLELVIDRLENDKVSYTDLKTKNEGVEFEEASLNYMSQLAIYNAALSVGSKLIQKSLVDFI